MSKLKIGCLCVTENRWPIIGIAAASFKEQSYENGVLFVNATGKNVEKTYDVVREIIDDKKTWIPSSSKGAVPERIQYSLEILFNDMACDIVTMWDDDDYASPDRLSKTEKLFMGMNPSIPFIASYDHGLFVNLRTLCGQWVNCNEWGFWGGTLTFNRAAWTRCSFSGLSLPGYDRQFADTVRKEKGFIQKTLLTDDVSFPVAFSHGRNIATWVKGHCESVEEMLEAIMPHSVFEEVKRAQRFLIDCRIFPPA